MGKDLGEEQAQGPVSIRDEMMHRHHEQMPLQIQPNQTYTPERTLLQIEWAGDLLPSQGQGLLLERLRSLFLGGPRVLLAPGELRLGGNALSGLITCFNKGCPEGYSCRRTISTSVCFNKVHVEWSLSQAPARSWKAGAAPWSLDRNHMRSCSKERGKRERSFHDQGCGIEVGASTLFSMSSNCFNTRPISLAVRLWCEKTSDFHFLCSVDVKEKAGRK